MSDIDRLLTQYLTRRISRRQFARRLMGLGVSLSFLETLLGADTRAALAAPRPATAPTRRPLFVLIVIDAFRTDYMDLASMPNLQWLISRGTFYPRAWVGQLESYTPTGHATLSTGATPAHQGVIGFEWRDPVTGKKDQTAWYEDVMAGRLEAQLEQHHVDSIPEAVKRQDPRARVVALSSEKYYAADAMGGHAADYIMFGMPVDEQIVTRGIPHHVPPESFLAQPKLTRSWPLRFEDFDHMAMDMALASLKAWEPRVLMINLPGTDIYGHRVGGPGTPDVMRRIAQGADRQIGRLLRAYRDRGLLDQTVFVVTSDHGMVKNTYQIENSVIKDAVKKAGGDYLFHVGGNSAYIWLRSPADAGRVARNMVRNFPHLPVYDGTDENAVRFAHYMTIDSGRYTYHPVTSTGSPLDPDLEAAYQYLLGTFAGPLAPDIALSYPENMISTAQPDIHGEHGGATWGAQQIPLVISGPGVRQGHHSHFPARLLDVAPTVLTLLGITPRHMDGVVLADALLKPSHHQVHRQDGIASVLTRYQKAIVKQSTIDIALQEDR